MAFFAEKVWRKLEGNFTLLLVTDRNDLDSQICRTFVGCGVADDMMPRAASGDDLERLLRENHRYVFSLLHKFNKDVNPKEPYSERDDITVISDEVVPKYAPTLPEALPHQLQLHHHASHDFCYRVGDAWLDLVAKRGRRDGSD